MNKLNKKISITFPDGNKKDYEKGITGNEIAENISKSLAKEAIAMSLNGIQKDLSDTINSDSSLSEHSAGKYARAARLMPRPVRATRGARACRKNCFYY